MRSTVMLPRLRITLAGVTACPDDIGPVSCPGVGWEKRPQSTALCELCGHAYNQKARETIGIIPTTTSEEAHSAVAGQQPGFECYPNVANDYQSFPFLGDTATVFFADERLLVLLLFLLLLASSLSLFSPPSCSSSSSSSPHSLSPSSSPPPSVVVSPHPSP